MKDFIIYNRETYYRIPESKYRDKRVYYWKYNGWGKPQISLHRQIWIDHFGEIPKGFHVHHKDESPITKVHIFIHKIHLELYKKIFPDRIEAIKTYSYKTDYVKAWEIALTDEINVNFAIPK